MQPSLEGEEVERDDENEAEAPGNCQPADDGAGANQGKRKDDQRGDEADLRGIVLGDGDRHGEREKEQYREQVPAGRGEDAQRQEAWPELQGQHGHMLVELRDVDLGDKAMTDRHVLGAVWPERRDRVHRETGERAVGEELGHDEARGAERTCDKGKRGAANLGLVERGNSGRCGEHHERCGDEKRCL